MRVLVVDDNPHCAWALASVLEMWGHEVVTAPDALQALTAFGAQPLDAMLVDVTLGADASGLDLAREIRQRGFPGLILAVSGHDRREILEEARRCGVDGYLVKPVEMEVLKEFVCYNP